MKATVQKNSTIDTRSDAFKTYRIDIDHRNGPHEGQIEVYGSRDLANQIAKLLNNQFEDMNTNAFAATPYGE